MAHIYIAVGHGVRPNGTYDPGAASGSKTEQSEGDPIALACARALEAAGHKVTHEAYIDDPNFVGSAAEANRLGVDLCLTIHHDWIKADRGFFCFWVSDEGKKFADSIYQRVEGAGFPMRPEWHRYRDNLYILNATNMPAVLIECDRIGEVHHPARMGTAIANGVLNVLGRKVVAEVPTSKYAQAVVGYSDVDIEQGRVLAQTYDLALCRLDGNGLASETHPGHRAHVDYAFLVGAAATRAGHLTFENGSKKLAGHDRDATAAKIGRFIRRHDPDDMDRRGVPFP